MAVVSVERRIGDEVASESFSEGRTATKVFLVTLDDVLDGPTEALRANDGVQVVPAPGATYGPSDADLVLARKSVARTDNRNVYIVTCFYSNPTNSNPLYQAISYHWSPVTRERVMVTCVKDRELSDGLLSGWPLSNRGLSVVTTAGEKYSPAPIKNDQLLKCRASFAYENFNADLFLPYVDSINADVVVLDGRPFAEHSLRFTGFEGRKVDEGGNVYYAITFDFLYAPDFEVPNPDGTTKTARGHDLVLLEAGTRQRGVGTPQELIPCLDDNGQPASTQQLLDNYGQQSTWDTGLIPFYTRRQVYSALDWDELLQPLTSL